jgi:hypothetical protein
MKNKKLSTKYFVGLLILGLIIGSIVGWIIMSSLLRNSEKFYEDEMLLRVDEIIEHNKNLSVTKQIFDSCSVLENESEQLLCVNRWAIDNYNYTLRDEVYTIDDMFTKGADCKSYSIYYATLANMMGYEYVFFNTNNHVMTIVYFDRGYCILDQDFGTCVYYV